MLSGGWAKSWYFIRIIKGRKSNSEKVKVSDVTEAEWEFMAVPLEGDSGINTLCRGTSET